MSHWWKYPLPDVLPFSLQVYYSFLVSYGQAIWPLQLFALAAGGIIIWLMLRAGKWDAAISILFLAAAWLLVAWLFFATHYALIFWAAPYFAIAFAVQALLLLLLAIACMWGHSGFADFPRRKFAVVLFTLSVFGYVLAAGALSHRAPLTEVFGLFPAPTAAATLAAVAALKGAIRWIAALIPIFWNIITAVIFAILGGYEAAVPPLMTIIAILAALAPQRSSSQ